MKNFIIFILVLISTKIVAQNPLLFDRTWTLDKMISSVGENILPPNNDELESITMNFYQEDYMITDAVGTLTCYGVFEGNPINDTQINYDEFYSETTDCEYTENCEFEEYYFFFFIYGMPTGYFIESEDNLLRLTLTNNSGQQAIYYSQNLSVTESDDTKFYTVYPNPVNEILTIRGLNQNNVSIQIFDVSGKLVYHNKLNVNQNKIEIPVLHLEKGIYFIKLFNKFGKFLHTEKIFKY
ncbi:T9SS type A sorting domain-containing protein [Vaginella massiliensis]|uniref:T9SS type A sorting domain-containing protein n=1 Tax=Vaginella massiliensis TaxID=1816680 RepID=UPI000B9A870E|nr:T9SS type A sorting domain-containing protein [Vaginella massiliensis]